MHSTLQITYPHLRGYDSIRYLGIYSTFSIDIICLAICSCFLNTEVCGGLLIYSTWAPHYLPTYPYVRMDGRIAGSAEVHNLCKPFEMDGLPLDYGGLTDNGFGPKLHACMHACALALVWKIRKKIPWIPKSPSEHS